MGVRRGGEKVGLHIKDKFFKNFERSIKRLKWVSGVSGYMEQPIVLYEYRSGRGICHPRTFLANFKGYLHIDGYSGYHNLPEDITVVGCWAHAKEKFDKVMKSLPKGKAKNSSAAQGLAYCSHLFKIEK